MELLNEFDVPLTADQTWVLLTDLEKVAPCLPGAAITSVEGDDFHGRAKIKVGPITAQYKGIARFTKLDEKAHEGVLSARGKDARGQGDVSATVTVSLSPADGGTRVTVKTELALTGKVAQFGRGVLADVSGALMSLFADRLREMIASEGIAPAPTSEVAIAPSSDAAPKSEAASASRVVPASAPPARVAASGGGRSQDDDVLDVLALAGGMSWNKFLPAAGTTISILAALVSVFAAGFAAARAGSARR